MNVDTLQFFHNLSPGTREVRILGPSNHSGTFVDPETAARCIHGFTEPYRGVYVTINPVNRPVTNTLRRGAKGATDADVPGVNYLFIDFDPVRAEGFTTHCATEEEKRQAATVVAQVEDHLRAKGFPDPMKVDSGNGYALYYRVGPGVTPELIKRILKHLATLFNTSGAKIDGAVHNPSRIVRVPGTMNRKGPDSVERPHRLAKLLYVPERGEFATVELLASLVDEAPLPSPVCPTDPWGFIDDALNPKTPVAATAPVVPLPPVDDPSWPPMPERATRCQQYLANVPGAVSGKGGHDATMRVARVIRNDFALDREHGWPLFVDWNKTCRPPWSLSELEHKWSAGNVASAQFLRGCKLKDRLNTRPDDPYYLADVVLEDAHLTYWNGFYRWSGRCHVALDDAAVDGLIGTTLERHSVRVHVKDQRRHAERRAANPDAPPQKPPVKLAVTVSMVRNTRAALQARTLLTGDTSPSHLLSLENGTLDLRTRTLSPHDPALFLTSSLPFAYALGGTCEPWLAILRECLNGDRELEAQLQEWFGYCLSPGNRHHRFALLCGEAGSGKSTIASALTALLGSGNVCALELERFTDRFGLIMALDKKLILCPDLNDVRDMRIGTMKGVVSGDMIQLEQKGKPMFSARLGAKLMVLANTPPYLEDRSNGIWRRLLFIPFERAITKPVRGLDDPAYWEKSGLLPGVLNWSLDGLARLESQGDFTRSTRGEAALLEHRVSCDPCRQFLSGYVADAEATPILTGDLYHSYLSWCSGNGARRPLSSAQFGKNLKRILPSVDIKWVKSQGKSQRCYSGLRELDHVRDNEAGLQVFGPAPQREVDSKARGT